MKIKCQKIPDSIWAKLEEISKLKEGSWNMMTIVNECINTGANWWLKKLKKEAGDQPATHERTKTNIPQKDPATEEAIKIARTKTYDFKD